MQAFPSEVARYFTSDTDGPAWLTPFAWIYLWLQKHSFFVYGSWQPLLL